MNDETNDSEDRLRFRTIGVIRGYLDLARLPNVFTAVADVTMGFLIARPPGDEWIPSRWDFGAWAMLAVASSLLYIAGVVLNDVFDLEHDRDNRPERPLPSGRVSAAAARRFGWTLLWLGVGFGTATGLFTGNLRSGVVATLLGSAILLYNGWLKRTPFGPLSMGLCRLLNVLLGIAAADIPLTPGFWLVAVAIGVYVTGVTWFARREAGQSNPLQLALATTIMASGIAMLLWFPMLSERVMPELRDSPQRWYMLVGILGAMIIWRCLKAVIEPTQPRVRMAVTQCVMSIIMLDAMACYAVRGMSLDAPWTFLILLLFIPAMLFNRWIEVT